MASSAQIDANRVNAQASTGPRTEAGKAACASNSTRHGLAGRVLFIEGEDPAEFQLLFHELSADHRPANLTEEALVYKMTEAFWFGRRAAQLLASALDLNTQQDNSRQVSLMLRYHTSADRAFFRSLHELRKLRKETPNPAIGSVSQNAPTPPPPAPPPGPAHPIGSVSQNVPTPPPPPTGPNPPIGSVSQKAPSKVGRNASCPCGSGKKFKRCCLASL